VEDLPQACCVASPVNSGKQDSQWSPVVGYLHEIQVPEHRSNTLRTRLRHPRSIKKTRTVSTLSINHIISSIPQPHLPLCSPCYSPGLPRYRSAIPRALHPNHGLSPRIGKSSAGYGGPKPSPHLWWPRFVPITCELVISLYRNSDPNTKS
jgi:hypothetical protein